MTAEQMTNQPVFIKGQDVDFQFARDSMGTRTIRRTVRRLRREQTARFYGQPVYATRGEVIWNGRLLQVELAEHDFDGIGHGRWIAPGTWYVINWTYIKEA